MSLDRQAGVFSNHRLLDRLSALLTVALVLCLPIAIYSCTQVWLNCHNDVTAWAGRGSSTEVIHQRFQRRFGGHETVTLTWEGAKRDDPRLLRFSRLLREPGYQRLFSTVTSTPELVQSLREKPLSLSDTQIERRLSGWATGTDGDSGWVLATLSPEGARDRKGLLNSLSDVRRTVGVEEGNLQVAGSGFWLAEVDRLSVESPLYAIPLILAVVVIGLRLRLGNWLATTGVIAVGVSAAVLTTALIGWSGVEMNAVLSTLPTLVFLTGVANCLHLVNHFLSSSSPDPVMAMRGASANTWRPTLFAGLTTVFGLLALLFSDTKPIQLFGCFGGIGVGMATTLALAVMPRLGSRWVWPEDRLLAAQKRYSQRSWPGAWRRWHAIVERWRWLIMGVSIALALLLAGGLISLQTSVQPSAFFEQGSRQLDAAEWIEGRFGGIDSFDIMIDFDNSQSLRLVDQLLSVATFREAVRAVGGVEAVIAAETFVPNVDARPGTRAAARRSLIDDRLNQRREELADAGLVAFDDEVTSWRLNARIASTADLDAIRLRIEDAVNGVMEADDAFALVPSRYWIAGSAALFRDVERQFLRDLVVTYLAGLLTVTVAVVWLLRSMRTGLAAMIPNALPGIAVLGATGWIGAVLEVGSIMTASVAIGIAVDDTMHFLSYYRGRLRAGATSSLACCEALQTCGGAMVQTSLICGGGLALFALCDFLPTVRFGVLLTLMLASALVADIVLLPALIASFPSWFAKTSKGDH